MPFDADSMTIKEKFQLFGIPQPEFGNFGGAHRYAQRFEKCSVLTQTPVTYSSQSIRKLEIKAK